MNIELSNGDSANDPKMKPVPDGRLRVENLEFMLSQPPRVFQWLRIDANDNCNLKCTYCRIPRSSALIGADDLKRFLTENVISTRHLQFGCGMEPTIDKRLTDLMLLASQTPANPSLRMIVQTNGTKLHNHDHAKMAKAGLKMLSVSIDSLDEDVHGFQRGGSSVKQIVTNLEEFRKNCPHVDIQFICVVTKESIGGVADVAEFAIELGVGRVAIREMMHVDGDPVADPVKVAPLIVPPGQFQAMTEELQPKISDRGTKFDFWPIESLHVNRFAMRRNAFPKERQGDWQRSRIAKIPTDNFIRAADKPVLAPLTQIDQNADLLAGKKFFVLRGFIKSGTSWAGRLLNLHPEISCAGEFHWQSVAEPFEKNIEQSKLLSEKEGLSDAMRRRFDRMMRECVVLANHSQATWVGDRTPVHIALNASFGTDSKIINMVRDGRDVLISRAHQFYANTRIFPQLAKLPENQRRQAAFKDDPEFFIKHPSELLGCVEFVRTTIAAWSDAVNANEAAVKEVDAENYLELRYETIHADTESARVEMYNFFDVDPTLAGELAFNTQAGFDRESPREFLRKGIVGDWKNYMSPEVRSVINEIAGDTLLRLGYIDSLDW